MFVFTKSLLVRTLGSTQNTVPLTEANVGTGPRKRYSGAHASAAVVPAQGGDPNGSGRGPRVAVDWMASGASVVLIVRVFII